MATFGAHSLDDLTEKKIRGHVVCYKAVLVSSRTRVPVKSFLRFVKQSDIIYTFDTVS